MGRTKRKRSRRRNHNPEISLENDSTIIALKQWMKASNWKNVTSLKMSFFKNTGRGLTSPKRILKMETLIEVPYELMITYTSLENFIFSTGVFSNMPGKLKMHDILSIYLVFERHRGSKSKWKAYIDSLPKSVPNLPWLSSSEEINRLPQVIESEIRDRLTTFKSSWKRSSESINPRWKCDCCGTPGHCVLTLNSFTWAYVMVNTRAVYVDPNIVCGLSRSNNLTHVLSDDPSMALCPYLDMFNHSHQVETSAKLERVRGHWVFQIITLTPSEKHKEIFISYGSHSNIKLLCEYGFFISDNDLDTVAVDFSEVLACSELSVDEKQYKFIQVRLLHRELNISVVGLSFNLKAVLFVILNSGVGDWCAYVFSENYSQENLVRMYSLAKKVMELKIMKCTRELCSLNENLEFASKSFKILLSYLEYRISFMKKLCKRISEEFS